MKKFFNSKNEMEEFIDKMDSSNKIMLSSGKRNDKWVLSYIDMIDDCDFTLSVYSSRPREFSYTSATLYQSIVCNVTPRKVQRLGINIANNSAGLLALFLCGDDGSKFCGDAKDTILTFVKDELIHTEFGYGSLNFMIKCNDLKSFDEFLQEIVDACNFKKIGIKLEVNKENTEAVNKYGVDFKKIYERKGKI